MLRLRGNWKVLVIGLIFLFLVACANGGGGEGVEEAPAPPPTVEAMETETAEPAETKEASEDPAAVEASVPATLTPSPEPVVEETAVFGLRMTAEGWHIQYVPGEDVLVVFYQEAAPETGYMYEVFDGSGTIHEDAVVSISYLFDASLWGSQAQLDELYRCAIEEITGREEFLTCLMHDPEEAADEGAEAGEPIIEETPVADANDGEEVDLPVCWIPEIGIAHVQANVNVDDKGVVTGTIDIITHPEQGAFDYQSTNIDFAAEPVSEGINETDGCFYTVIAIPSDPPSGINFTVNVGEEVLWDQDLWLR